MLSSEYGFDGVLKRYVKLKSILMILAALGIAFIAFGMAANDDPVTPISQPKPALTVTTTQPQLSNIPLKISANGNIAAWQEASIGNEIGGLRLTEVKVDVGNVVARGQVLAIFSADTVQADLAQARAAVSEAEAMLAEASANAQRARDLQPKGFMSAQQINQYLTAERTAQARLEAQRANVEMQQLRLKQTQILAPDHGVISARSATVGAVLPTGQELFRMIRQGRLEWRAEVASADLASLKPGMRARVIPANGIAIKGTVRKVAPMVDAQTRNGLVYVDLPSPGVAKAGMFAHGEFEIGGNMGMTLPQSAVLLRDGFSYVLSVGLDSKVSEVKVATGRRVGDRIEITGGLDASVRVVAAGGGFLADGDAVRVVDSAPVKSTAKLPVKPVSRMGGSQKFNQADDGKAHKAEKAEFTQSK